MLASQKALCSIEDEVSDTTNSGVYYSYCIFLSVAASLFSVSFWSFSLASWQHSSLLMLYLNSEGVHMIHLFATALNQTLGCAMSGQSVSGVYAVAQVQSLISSCGMCDGQSCIGTGFSPHTSVSLVSGLFWQYSILIHPLSVLYNLSN
jgi:hypothetical protein